MSPGFDQKGEDVTEENRQARLRGLFLMSFSDKDNHLLLTTGDKSASPGTRPSNRPAPSCGHIRGASKAFGMGRRMPIVKRFVQPAAAASGCRVMRGS